MLLRTLGIHEARACRARPRTPEVTARHRAELPRIQALRQWLLRQPAGWVFLLLAITYVGRPNHGEDFDLLDVYCHISDTAHTVYGAVEQLLGRESLFDDLRHGLWAVEDSSVDLDRWMGK
jgi:hypothetical protein